MKYVQGYDEMLNDSTAAVMVRGIRFYPADILRHCRPKEYAQGLLEYEEMIEEGY